MKKNYETPAVEIVEFNYCDQVVASSIGICISQLVNVGDENTKTCVSGWKHWQSHDNV